jgi:phosphoribosylanthranilate isomerase
VTQVKICGLTDPADALAAAEAGADMLGFIFYAPSPRYIAPRLAARMTYVVRLAHPAISLVGVFVDEAPGRVAQITDRCGLDCVQLHGEESPEAVDELIARGLKVIKAFRVRDTSSLREMTRYRPTYYLLDTYVPGEPGGTGAAFDWRLASRAPVNRPLLLAGGLSPDNVAEAVQVARPWGVDVSSGVEARPGRKDPDKVRRFIEVAKGAGPEVQSN